MYEIEKNVPVPKTHPTIRASRYPFKQMKVGESFAVPVGENAKSVAGAAYAFGKKNGQKFCYRKQENGAYRVWRIA